MRILIDDHIGVEVEARWAKSEDGEPELVVPFLENVKIMEAWLAADPAHRNYRYGGSENDTDADVLIVAWVAKHNGSLVMGDVNPWWDGTTELNAYPLNALAGELGDVLKWGAAIDEPVDAGGWEDR